MRQTPAIVIEKIGPLFLVKAEFGPKDRSLLACERSYDDALAAAGKARIDYDAAPVIDRTGKAAP